MPCAARYLVITPVQDTLNESGYVSDSLAAIKGRTIHTYHSEGAGGGHAPRSTLPPPPPPPRLSSIWI